MKTLVLLILAVSLFVLPLMGCQVGQKVGYVNCCIAQMDGTRKCVNIPQGECKNTIGAYPVADCGSCK
jgi:hypothetical protein